MTAALRNRSALDYRNYLLAATPFVVVFLIMPCELFFTQAEEWDVQLWQVAAVPLAGLLGWVLTSLLLAGLGRWRRGWAEAAAALLFVVGCYLLLADLYSPVQMNSLDGADLSSDEPFKYTLLELGIGLVLLVALGLLLKGRGERVASVFAVLLVLAGLAYGGVVAAYMLTPEPVVTSADANTEAGSGNVYHIVLDRMQTDAFLESVERADARSAFEGFELFSNNVSNYMITVPSRASYLSGTFYHEGNYKEWHKGIWRRQGIQKMLDDQGFRVWNYVPFRQWRDPSVDVFRYILDVYRDRTGIAGSSFSDFLVLWLLRPVPNFLTNEALSPVGKARDLVLAGMDGLAGFSSTKGGHKRLTMREGLQVVASKHSFEQAALDEEKRASSGEYVYLHAVLPHLPYVFDAACSYHGPPTRKLSEEERRDAYLDQAVCSVRLIRDFLDRLKALERYDDATIIIHADTGAEEGFLADPADYRSAGTTLGRADNHLLSGVNALLMIKRPNGGRGPLRISDQVTQLVDLFPSLADILDLEDRVVDAPVHGRSIYAEKDEPRDVRFGFDPEELFGANFVEVRIETPEDIRRSPLTVVGPALAPATWRPEIRNVGK